METWIKLTSWLEAFFIFSKSLIKVVDRVAHPLSHQNCNLTWLKYRGIWLVAEICWEDISNLFPKIRIVAVGIYLGPWDDLGKSGSCSSKRPPPPHLNPIYTAYSPHIAVLPDAKRMKLDLKGCCLKTLFTRKLKFDTDWPGTKYVKRNEGTDKRRLVTQVPDTIHTDTSHRGWGTCCSCWPSPCTGRSPPSTLLYLVSLLSGCWDTEIQISITEIIWLGN